MKLYSLVILIVLLGPGFMFGTCGGQGKVDPGEEKAVNVRAQAGITTEDLHIEAPPGARVETESDPQTGNITRIIVDNREGRDVCRVRVNKKDPLVVQLPDDASDFAGTFVGPTTGSLIIESGLTSVDVLPGVSIPAEQGHQLVLISVPEHIPDGDYQFNLEFDLDPPRALEVKAANLAILEIYGKTFFPPNLPIFNFFEELESFTVPVSEEMVELSVPPAGPPGTLEVQCDVMPPTCELIERVRSSHIRVQAQDLYSGLREINVLAANNANVVVPAVTQGTDEPAIVSATKIVSDQPAQVALEVIDVAGNVTTCDPVLVTLTAEVPALFVLEQNYPNPFNPTTTIRYQVTEAVPVRLEVHDALGRRVALLIDQVMEAGVYEATWDARDDAGKVLPSGTYYYRLTAGDFSETKAMTLLR